MESTTMKRISLLFLAAILALPLSLAHADEIADTVQLFKNAGDSGRYFAKSYGYAVFPTIGKGGLGVGGAHGKGEVYVGGKHVGDTTMNQLSIGLQAGGQAFSQIVFFQDKRAFDEFTRGDFELDAQASAVAITAGATAGVGTAGARSGASAGKKDAQTDNAGYYKGLSIFYIVKGGAMYEAAVAGQKFSYKPVGK
jgi:lipid-binding SYLF domain-containing protein